MDAQKLKAKRTVRRQYRVRKTLYGTPERPRLSVFRSNLHIYAQLIDDLNGVTLAAATSAGKDAGLKHGGNVQAAAEVGKKIAEKAKALSPPVTAAALDRGPYRFHGRIAALARAATQAGLVCTGLDAPKPKEAAPPAEAPAKAPKEGGKDKAPKGEGKPKGDAGKKDKKPDGK
ncbi:MAG: rplR [Gemmataceae bacterium]|nr:rplR [Gemmataceae bacterium]